MASETVSETAKTLAMSAAAAAASTDGIRKQRGTLAWNQALAAELGATREAREVAARESAAQSDNRAQDELRRRKKDTGGPYVDAGIPPQGPSGPSGPGSKVKKKVGRIVLPRNNLAQNTCSSQPAWGSGSWPAWRCHA